MRRIIFAVLVAMSWAAHAAKPAEPAQVEFGAGAWVDVDATGKAHVVEMDPLRDFKDEDKPGSLAEVIKARLRERIESWEFTPPTKNGVSVAGKTYLNMHMQAFDTGSGSIGLRIESATTGMALRKRSSYLPLSDELGMSNYWWVSVYLEVGPDGRVVEARIRDSSLFHGKGAVTQAPPRVAKAVRKMFEGYEFDNESVGGEPIAGEAIQPIVACQSNSSCGAAEREMQGEGESPDFAVMDPAVQLRTAVAGMNL